MTQKEKAKELVEKFKNRSVELGHSHSQLLAEANALIAVDEMIKELDELLEGDERSSAEVYYLWVYYNEVKQEIQKL